ncbi:MAG: CHAD domain-containing protein, partial [Beijerinckiaceae bacterium]
RGSLVKEFVEAADLLEARDIPIAQRIKTVRSGLKRNSALLRLAPDAARKPARRLERSINAVRNELGQVRDILAMAEALDDLKPGRKPQRRASDIQLIGKWRSWFSQRSGQSLLGRGIDRQAAILRKAARLAARLPRGCAEDQEIVDKFHRDYRRARRRMPNEANAEDTDGLHRFRRAVIDHRYELELLLPGASERVDELEALRRSLGAIQDLEMLKDAICERSDGMDSDRLWKLADRRQHSRARKAIRLAAPLFDKKTRRLWPENPIFYGTVAMPAHAR